MKRLFMTLVCTLALAQTCTAKPAVYRDNMLRLSGAAVINEDSTAFYRDIRMEANEEGQFRVISAQRATLAEVESVDVTLSGTTAGQADLTVAGNKSVPCVELETPAVSREDDTFTVVLAETAEPEGEACTQVLDPFETTYSFDISGLEAGEYTVNVNGVETSFTLEADAQ